MPPKRNYSIKKRKVARKYGTTVKKANVSASVLQSAVRRVLQKNLEKKQSCYTSTDYTQIQHNSFVNIDTTILATTPGIYDPNTGNTANRIGDQISLKRIEFRMMLELNERYSDCTFRIIVVKTSKGDVPTISTLWVGLSGNKMLDNYDRERYTVLYEKWGKIKAPGLSVGRRGIQDVSATELSTGIYLQNDASVTLSRATKIVKFTLPYSKFSKNGVIQYENGLSQVKMFDYYVLVYAYANYNTLAPTSLTSGYNVLAVNDYVKILHYTDA